VGPAAVLTSVADPALAAAAVRAAAAAHVTGLASLDFVRDAGGGYHFLELNPRPWGSIDAAARAERRPLRGARPALAGGGAGRPT
jgi:D-alanine-D-alanine ligase-like ATP-grasp enzyme